MVPSSTIIDEMDSALGRRASSIGSGGNTCVSLSGSILKLSSFVFFSNS